VAATRDHVVPKKLGGTKRVWACRQCNGLKADMMPDEWTVFMARHPEWWKMPEFKYGMPRRVRMVCVTAVLTTEATG
jgi:hypothetical protein